MSSNQDPTAPTTDGTPRDWARICPRPIRWFCEIALSLSVVGVIISWVIPLPLSDTWSTAAMLLIWLPLCALVTTVGTLLALSHPWGACFRVLVAQRRFTHHRLVGVALVWAGLFMGAFTSAILYLAYPPFPGVFPTADGWKGLLAEGLTLLAIVMVGAAPLLALALFDRRR